MSDKRNSPRGPLPHEAKVKQMEGPDLENLIERAQNEDAGALAEIHNRFARRVLGLCRYMLDSPESAEDATSEVFLKLQRSIASYDGSAPFASWLLRMAGNHCIDTLRQRQRGRRVIVQVEDDAINEAPSPELSPLGAVIRTEERAHVRDAIAHLPVKFRLPLVLRYYNDLTYDQIAQQLGLEKNHVATLIFRAKQELRRKLAHRSK